MAAKRVAAIFVAARTLPENSYPRYPLNKLEKKVALCRANKISRALPRELPVPRTNLFGFQPKPPLESAPVAKLLTNSKMTLWMTESTKVERLPREARCSRL
jgi:hypothetical protein